MDDTQVPLRVQVVPLGAEYARLREPVFRWRADKVVALEYADGDADLPYLAEFLGELEANDRIDLERRTCDLFDFYDALGSVAAAIDDHAGDDVYVNISSGSRITAVAGAMACMMTGATPLYARPDYGPDGDRLPSEPTHETVAEVQALPAYPVETPPDEQLAVLAHVAAAGEERDATGRYAGVSKGDLVAYVRESGFPFVASSNASTEKGYYRLLDSHVLDPLLERGDVDVTPVGRSKYVSITDAGERTLRAFGHRIEG